MSFSFRVATISHFGANGDTVTEFQDWRRHRNPVILQA